MEANTPKERLLICSDCDHLFQPTYTCKKCGCFMKVKVQLRKSECPIGLWGKIDSSKD
jgi:hypothetical protein